MLCCLFVCAQSSHTIVRLTRSVKKIKACGSALRASSAMAVHIMYAYVYIYIYIYVYSICRHTLHDIVQHTLHVYTSNGHRKRTNFTMFVSFAILLILVVCLDMFSFSDLDVLFGLSVLGYFGLMAAGSEQTSRSSSAWPCRRCGWTRSRPWPIYIYI